jgi:hypothetical protein
LQMTDEFLSHKTKIVWHKWGSVWNLQSSAEDSGW